MNKQIDELMESVEKKIHAREWLRVEIVSRLMNECYRMGHQEAISEEE